LFKYDPLIKHHLNNEKYKASEQNDHYGGGKSANGDFFSSKEKKEKYASFENLQYRGRPPENSLPEVVQPL